MWITEYKAWSGRGEGPLLRAVLFCAALQLQVDCLEVAVQGPWPSRSRRTGDVTNAAHPSRRLLWSCLVLSYRVMSRE